MARVIAAVSCFVAAFQAVAERPRKSRACLEREPPEADQDGIFVGGIGRTLDEYKADVERRKNLIAHSSTEGQDVQGGDNAMNISFAELGSLGVKCTPPEVLYPNMCPKYSTKWLGGGAFGDAYRVSINGCPGGKGQTMPPMVMKSVGVPRGKTFDMLLELAWTEVLVGESLAEEPALVTTLAHTKPSMQQQGACFYMLMDYANYGDVKSILKTKKLSFTERAIIFHESLVGLTRLHNRGIVHRDIKHENIFIRRKEKIFCKGLYCYKPRIGDFGLSCFMPNRKPYLKEVSVAKCEKVLVGTPGYMSPQVVQYKEATPDDDLWSMGKLLLQLVFNQVDVYFTEKEVRYDNQNLKKFDGVPLLSVNDKKKLMGRNGAGGQALVNLLDYLLCSACPVKKQSPSQVDALALHLSGEWLGSLGLKPYDPQPIRSEKLESCVGELVQLGQLKLGAK